jgi:DNA modification methylase
MKRLPDACVDLTITSPPYESGKTTLRTFNGYSFDFKATASELFRVTKQGGVVVWVIQDQTINGSESGESFRQALGFMAIGFRLHDTMIGYNVGTRYPHRNRYTGSFQFMFVFSKGKPATANIIKDKPNKHAGTKKNVTERNTDGSIVKRNPVTVAEYANRQNVWAYSAGYSIAADRLWTKHPAVFSLQLAKDHVTTWSNAGDLVFDPMCGSGQTLVAADVLDRRWLGMDCSAEYCELAHERLAWYRENR